MVLIFLTKMLYNIIRTMEKSGCENLDDFDCHDKK